MKSFSKGGLITELYEITSCSPRFVLAFSAPFHTRTVREVVFQYLIPTRYIKCEQYNFKWWHEILRSSI